MYLAGILVLGALLHAQSPSCVRGVCLFSGASLDSQTRAIFTLQRSSSDPRSSEGASQDQPKPDTQSKPDAQPPDAQPAQDPSAAPPPAPSQTPDAKSAAPDGSPANKPASSTRKTPKSNKRTAADKDKDNSKDSKDSKTVIHRGGTGEPTTQLSPGMTPEQAARQRQSTHQLLASTDSALRRLSARLLSGDEQNTVAQIRKFMEQSKTADAAGDLQRSYKLALKAHLLSDELIKE